MSRRRPILAPAPQRRFRLVGLVMLFVVMLCAGASGGEPRTRLIGSAFDPSTTSVALNPKVLRPKILRPKVSRAVAQHMRRALWQRAAPAPHALLWIAAPRLSAPAAAASSLSTPLFPSARIARAAPASPRGSPVGARAPPAG